MANWRIRRVEDNTVLYSGTNISGLTPIALTFVDAPAQGTWTYVLEVQASYSGLGESNINAALSNITILKVKK